MTGAARPLAGLGERLRGLRAARRPWRDARYCVVDLELTGLDPRADEIISFGAVPIDDGRVIAGRAAHSPVAEA